MKKYILLSVISIFSIMILFGISTEGTKNGETRSYLSDKDIDSNKKLLSHMYYENLSDAFFSSSGVDMWLSNQVNIYNATYLLSSFDQVNYKLPSAVENDLTNFLLNQNDESLNSLDLIDLQRIVHLYNLTGHAEEYRDILGESITRYFNPSEGLFFMGMPSDPISSQIIASNWAFGAYNLLGYLPNGILDKVYPIYEELINNDEYFTFNLNDFKRNVFDEGFIILDTLRILAKYDTRFELLLSEQANWFEFWYSEVENYVSSLTVPSLSASMAIVNFNRMADVFNLQTLKPEAYIAMLDLDFLEDMLHQDAQIFLNHLQVYLLSNNPSDIIPLFDNIIYKKYFYTTSTPQSFTSDPFFGTDLANFFGISYDPVKLLLYLDSRYLPIQDLSIPDYFWLTCSYLNLDSNYNQSSRYQLVKSHLSDTNQLIEFANSIHRNFYYVLKLDSIYNLNLNFEEAYTNLLVNLDFGSIEYIEDIYFLHRIIYEYYPEFNVEPEQWNDYIMRFRGKEEGFMASIKSEIPDIISSYYAAYILNAEDKIRDGSNLEDFRSFTSKVCGAYGGYFIQEPVLSGMENYKYLFSLDSFWYAHQLNQIVFSIESR